MVARARGPECITEGGGERPPLMHSQCVVAPIGRCWIRSVLRQYWWCHCRRSARGAADGDDVVPLQEDLHEQGQE